jgi:hypothetical protein
MVQRLHLTIEITERPCGDYEARCPELSLDALGRSPDEAIDRLKELVFSSMSGGFDSPFPESKSVDLLYSILSRNRHCYLHFPPDLRVH